jgi:hypothetical protein
MSDTRRATLLWAIALLTVFWCLGSRWILLVAGAVAAVGVWAEFRNSGLGRLAGTIARMVRR